MTGTLHNDASPSVLNALAILESFDEKHVSQSLSDLSRRLGIAKASAFRNLAALEHHGYVTRDAATGLYSLGAQVLRLSRRFSEQNHLMRGGSAHIAELARATGETSHLSILSGQDILYVDVAEGSQHIRAVVGRGDRFPAHGMASGKAILAHVPAEQLTAFLAAGLNALTPRTIVSPDRFIDELETVRRLGYGTTSGEWMDDVAAISAPVFSFDGKVVGAIGIAGPRLRLGPKLLAHLSAAVVLQAERFSRDLGGDGARPRAAPARRSGIEPATRSRETPAATTEQSRAAASRGARTRVG